MSFGRQYRFHLLFAFLLIFCSAMVLWQINANQSKHLDLRESFILLYSRGYRTEAQRLYQSLLDEMEHLPDKVLFEDFQRTLTLCNPAQQQPENLIWEYHWTVSNELEKRSAASLKRALKLAQPP